MQSSFRLGRKEKMRDLKTLAMQAKNRLKGICEEKNTKGNLRLIKGNQNQIKVIVTEDESDKLYERYKDVVTEDMHNPIAAMMDKKLYSQLAGSKKEKYFFDTLDKYQKLRERCCKEVKEDINIFVG